MPISGVKKFSIIIPSYNRKDELRELLQSLINMEFERSAFEVVVADDGSNDGTEEFIRQVQKSGELPLKYYSQENQGPGAARNMGMAKAQGDFFIFIDSDVTVPVDWLKNIARKLELEKGDAFGGPDTDREDFPPLLKAINYSMTSFLTTGGLRGKKGKKLAKFYPRSFNMGLSRQVYEKIGGFGSLRHGQDIEYSHRILGSGAKVIFIENAVVYHKRRTNLRRFYKQVFNWGVARINLYKTDKGMLELLHAAPAVITLACALVLIAAALSSVGRVVFYAGCLLTIVLVLVAMLDAWRRYKNLATVALVPVVIPAQIFGYGMGFIYNFIRRVIFNLPEKVGFKKNYYK